MATGTAFLPQDPLSKVEHGKAKKDEGDRCFKAGDLTGALRAYHEAVMYLNGIDKNLLGTMMGNPEEPPRPVVGAGANEEDKEKPLSEVDDLLAKIYSNQSACHMKNGKWKRAWETADQALKKNPKNYKAQFRKGKAQAELGYVEKALATLKDLQTKNPDDAAAINAEIARVEAADKEREKKHNQKFKGFLNRAKTPSTTSSAAQTPVSEVSSTTYTSATITEVESEEELPPKTPLASKKDVHVKGSPDEAANSGASGEAKEAPIDLTV